MDRQNMMIVNLQSGKLKRVPNVRRQDRHGPRAKFDDESSERMRMTESQWL